jgi:hypothetical protein
MSTLIKLHLYNNKVYLRDQILHSNKWCIHPVPKILVTLGQISNNMKMSKWLLKPRIFNRVVSCYLIHNKWLKLTWNSIRLEIKMVKIKLKVWQKISLNLLKMAVNYILLRKAQQDYFNNKTTLLPHQWIWMT